MTAEAELLQRVRAVVRADTTIGFDEGSIVLAGSAGPSKDGPRRRVSVM